ncbi:hypothetical protein UFOVP920_3 [uncultured Caudovirales phage]|uniref:Uncharacterized protein n=1 Tax=uncultured Caudovirales phage TaxID=2100421 RepID=A0A6J5PHY8_9CAUD|nr:hypothetical protein UFOVP920_3 [uncultured Caudovirales phage]CAB4199658.1 hypothetical protein UFOVP1345_3 [uncultured Caudovirales phage]CAB5228577.1 hypothetical protein UFOVP1542_3 [uncultured Caudovirales phage]
MNKQAIIDALRAFLATRPGFDPGNYSDAASYRADMRTATRQRHDAERFLRDVELRDSITAEDILREAQGGRVEITLPDARQSDGMVSNVVRVHYTAGQYYCTEYRGAVARLLASVLWAWKRDEAMPEGETDGHGNRRILSGKAWVTPGSWLRSSFAREYGRGIASRYFS